ncbi:hypothetical protein PRZ48_011366 [Zasmidium cellare]|uniref:BTB domain-containing protein n=1 Tax=Zasmidium cellare TaxID=395010 RepID=A0ABR0E662_ZASCE|nr:hypothetical protein PRZ48_011366 [Zasmidium cellare]
MSIEMDPIITTLLVNKGPTQYLCRVPRALLCHYSKYFAAAYRRAWKESVEDRFVFDKDVDAEVLQRVLAWMYDGELGLGDSDDDWEDPLAAVHERDTWFSTMERSSGNPLAAMAEAASREQNAAEREQVRRNFEASENGRLCADEWIEDIATYPTVSSPSSPNEQSEQDVEASISPADSWIEDLAVHTPLPSTSSSDDDLAKLLEMYILADRFDIPLLRLQIEDELADGDFEPSVKVVRRAEERLPGGCGFLEWVGEVLRGEAEAVLV